MAGTGTGGCVVRTLATVLALALTATMGYAQMQLPPGTSSSVPTDDRTAAPSPETSVLQKAEDAIAAGKYDAAVTLLTPLATASQKNGRVFYDLGFAQDALGHDAEATAAYKTSLQLDSNNAAARVSFGLLLARGSDRAAAEEQLAAAVKITDADPALLARANRALAQIHLEKNPAQASDDLLAALKLSPEQPEDAMLAAEIAEALQDNVTAEKAWAHAAQMSPADPDVAVGYARALTRAKKFDAAQQALAPAHKQHPQNTQVLAEIASVTLLGGHVEEALPLLDQLRQAEPDNMAVALLQARAYAASTAPERADALYAKLLAASPNDPVLLAEVGDNYIRERRSPEAEPLLQRALAHPEGFPTQKDLANAAGELAFAASTNHDSETVLKALAIRDGALPPGTPANPPFTFLAATAHDSLHHSKLAIEQYRLFLQQSGGKFADQEWQAQQRLQTLTRMSK